MNAREANTKAAVSLEQLVVRDGAPYSGALYQHFDVLIPIAGVVQRHTMASVQACQREAPKGVPPAWVRVSDGVPFVEDDGRLFDTELLLLAEEEGYRIFEVPVDWRQSRTDNLNSQPNTDKSIITAYLKQ